MDSIRVTWHEGRLLGGTIEVIDSLGLMMDEDMVSIDGHRAQLYRHYDACLAADQAGRSAPPAEGALTEAQRRTIELVQTRWKEVTDLLARFYPKPVRPFLEWTSLSVDWKENYGYAYVDLRGSVGAPFDTAYDEHGIEAMMAGLTVIEANDESFEHSRNTGEPEGPTRLGPLASDADREAMRSSQHLATSGSSSAVSTHRAKDTRHSLTGDSRAGWS